MAEEVKYSKFYNALNKPNPNTQKDKPEETKPIKKENEQPKDVWFDGRVYNCAVLNFREQPNTNSKVLNTFEENSILTILDYDKIWYKVKDAEGNIGYCMKEFIKAIN